jgi:hypothetical protein
MEKISMDAVARQARTIILGMQFLLSHTFHSTMTGGLPEEEAWKVLAAASSFFWPT